MLNNEALDDTPAPDTTPHFHGGLVTNAAPSTLRPDQFSVGVNTMVRKAGEIQTRRGWERVGAFVGGAAAVDGLGYLDTAAGVRKLLRARGGACEAYDGTSWAAAAGYAPIAGQPVDIVQGTDKLYLTNGGFTNMYSWDGTTFTALGIIGPKYLCWGTNRLIVAFGNPLPDEVWFSDILAPGTFGATNKIRVGGGDGSPITGLAMWTKTLLAVTKRNRIYIVNIDPAVSVSAFPIEEVPAALGCVSHRSLTRVGRDLWFLANDKTVRSLSRVLQGEDQDIASPISLPIQNELDAMSEDYLHTACGTYFANRFLLSFVTTSPTRKIASFNQELNGGAGGWEGLWTSDNMLRISQFARTYFSGRERLVGADDVDGSVQQWRSYNSEAAEVTADYQDNNGAPNPITTRIRTRGHVYGADQNLKQGFAVETEFATSTATSAQVKVLPDEGAAVALSGVTPSGKVPLTLLHQPPFRSAQFEIETTADKVAVRAVRSTGFMQTMAAGQ